MTKVNETNVSASQPTEAITPPAFGPFGPGIADLHRSLDDSLTVRHISVVLETCSTVDDAKAVQRRMEEKNFDVLGVTENGRLRGYVRREDLISGNILKHCQSFGHSQVIASGTPLVEVLPLLYRKPFLFVLHRTSIDGLVTRADLRKAPMSLLLLGLSSLLESHLKYMVEICFPNESFRDKLWGDRLAMAEGVQRRQKEKNEDMGLADCLKLFDKYKLLIDVPGFRDFFRLGSADQAKQQFDNMAKIRDNLAHGLDLDNGLTWQKIVGAVEKLESFLMDCDNKGDEFVKKFSKVKT